LKKIGLLGGSFDPPHKGHLFISLEAKKVLKLDEVWWIVTPQNPLKILKPATYEERLNNCIFITRNYPIHVKEIEKKISSDYSYKTINYILRHYQNIKFFWLMGADNLINLHKWQKWQKIFENMSIVIFKRHGYNNKALKSVASKKFINSKIVSPKIQSEDFNKMPSWAFIENKEIKISSTEIRNQREKLRGKN
tara:strand:+ start:8127 stop:8708 length:582 start_codon:yes stop_codon:yes gene_type:complete